MEIEQIQQKIQEFKDTFLGESWVWRKGQEEAIIEIIQTYIDKTHNIIILDAPVGLGKSIIGMAVSWILNQQKKQGYILSSDLSLQEQYEHDIKKFNLNYGSVKGVDNYECSDNFEKHSLGTCRIRGKKPRSMPCYDECPYFIARRKASLSPTALLNYSYYLIMMNYVNQHLNEAPFPPRDFLIADEAHKIVDIVQNHYSPKFDSKTLEKLNKLTHFFSLYKIKDHKKDFNSVKRNIKKLFEEENQDELHNVLIKIEQSFETYRSSWEILKSKVDKEYPHEDPPKQWREALWLCDWLKDLHCKIEDFNDIISSTSTRNLVKNPLNEEELQFNCLEEQYMMHKYFHQWAGFTVLMSATFADPQSYMKGMAIKSAKYIKLDSIFDFSKSPIYVYSGHKMNYTKIERNLPWLYNKINEILDTHSNENGIIHSVSYDLTMKIYTNIDKKHRNRILVYNGTEEKKNVLEQLKKGKNSVLMGPSLIEGLNLTGDFSRFCIFAKVPYLSLSDRFVSTKLKISPEWYRQKSILNILQGTGRSIRFLGDYAITYILDDCFIDLLHYSRKSFPQEFLQRIKNERG